jgi:carbon storage regulator
MLILSRKANESIVVGDNIRITVASIRGRYVRLGIEAPDDVEIFREEICPGPATVQGPPVVHTRRRVRSCQAHRSDARVGGGEIDEALASKS